MMAPLFFGTLFGLLAALFAAWGLSADSPWAFALLWASFAYFVGSSAYLLNLPMLFGKKNGSVGWLATFLTLPYLATMRGIWWMRKLISNEAIYDEVVPNIFVGRRPLATELPPHVGLVVDLTCEFSEEAGVREGRRYLCVPTMDGSVPPDVESFKEVMQEAVSFPGTLYIHCAYGHGRAALMAAAILVGRGIVASPKDAFTLMRKTRKGIRPNVAQGRWLKNVTHEAQG
jgi:protein-tyrosine phosphatase